jgi:hypothetical protein
MRSDRAQLRSVRAASLPATPTASRGPRLARSTAQQAAYRRLAAAILGLDVEHLAAQLRAARTGLARAA